VCVERRMWRRREEEKKEKVDEEEEAAYTYFVGVLRLLNILHYAGSKNVVVILHLVQIHASTQAHYMPCMLHVQPHYCTHSHFVTTMYIICVLSKWLNMHILSLQFLQPRSDAIPVPITEDLLEHYLWYSNMQCPSFSTERSCRQEDETTAAKGKHSPQQCARRVFSQHIFPGMALW
jgi:hypothetical protein